MKTIAFENFNAEIAGTYKDFIKYYSSKSLCRIYEKAKIGMKCAKINKDNEIEIWERVGSSYVNKGNFAERCSKIAFAIPKFPSEFSKSIGFTLCGIADEPISPSLIFCLK